MDIDFRAPHGFPPVKLASGSECPGCGVVCHSWSKLHQASDLHLWMKHLFKTPICHICLSTYYISVSTWISAHDSFITWWHGHMWQFSLILKYHNNRMFHSHTQTLNDFSMAALVVIKHVAPNIHDYHHLTIAPASLRWPWNSKIICL